MTIILDNICKSYDGAEVVNNFKLEIEWDKCYGIVGPEHSGKTAILEIFMGLEKPDKGEVVRMGDYKYPTLKSAYVSQHGQLNMKKSAVWNVKKAHRWLGTSNATEELNKFMDPDRINIPVSELTELERKYVEIVKAMFVPADFIVMDEPFDEMDGAEQQKVMAYVLDKRGSRPLLVAAKTDTGLKFDRIVHLE